MTGPDATEVGTFTATLPADRAGGKNVLFGQSALPSMKAMAGIADGELAVGLHDVGTGTYLPQDPNDLLFRVLRSVHVELLSPENSTPPRSNQHGGFNGPGDTLDDKRMTCDVLPLH